MNYKELKKGDRVWVAAVVDDNTLFGKGVYVRVYNRVCQTTALVGVSASQLERRQSKGRMKYGDGK